MVFVNKETIIVTKLQVHGLHRTCIYAQSKKRYTLIQLIYFLLRRFKTGLLLCSLLTESNYHIEIAY